MLHGAIFGRVFGLFAKGLLCPAANEGVGLRTAFQNFGRFLDEFPEATQFAGVVFQWPKNRLVARWHDATPFGYGGLSSQMVSRQRSHR